MLYISIFFSLIIPFLTIRKKALTVAASLFAGLMIFISFWCGGYYGGFWLLFSYGAIVVIDKICKPATGKIMDSINKKTATRDLVQVIVNGGAALISVILFYLTKNDLFMVCYAVGISESLCDSVASDVGVLSKATPVNICTWKPIQKGMSGGISFLGTISAFVASVIGGTSFLIAYNDLRNGIRIAVVSFLGCLIDSILGATVQIKNTCVVCHQLTEKDSHCGKRTQYCRGVKCIDNCAVNFISNIASVALTFAIGFWR